MASTPNTNSIWDACVVLTTSLQQPGLQTGEEVKPS